MSGDHGIPERTLAQIGSVLAQFPGVEEAILFGSRAKGTHRLGSDIDLALSGVGLDWQTLGRIEFAFDDLPTPYCFSLAIRDERLDPEVEAHIQRVGIPIYRKREIPIRS